VGQRSSRGIERKAFIESSDLFKLDKHQVAITRDEGNTLAKRGYAAWQSFGETPLGITSDGKQYFDGATGFGRWDGPLAVIPKIALQPKVIEITGITGDQPATKVVEYKWKWDSSGQPPEIQSYCPH